jgi:hypothetical protein
MYKLFDLIKAIRRALRRALQPYTVLVVWEERMYAHGAWTQSDAREWLACYPAAAKGEIYSRVGRLVAARGHAEGAASASPRVALWDEN